jgi:hypothetical protein
VKHQGVCQGDLEVQEDCLRSVFVCVKCLDTWTKKKRRPKNKTDAQCTWALPCNAHPGQNTITPGPNHARSATGGWIINR